MPPRQDRRLPPPPPPALTVRELTVTPEIAAELLARSAGNRRLHQSHLAQLVDAMRRGQWRPRADPIKIDDRGRLVDGHHRLTAVIQSGATVSLVVLEGVASDAVEVLDCGRPRKLSYRLGAPQRVVAAIGAALTITYSGAATGAIDRHRALVESDLGAALQDLLDVAGSVKRYVTAAPVHLAAALRLIDPRVDPEYVRSTWRALATGDYAELSPVAFTLVKQVATGSINAVNTRDALARGLRVYDSRRANSAVIRLTAGDVEAAMDLVRQVVRDRISEGGDA